MNSNNDATVETGTQLTYVGVKNVPQLLTLPHVLSISLCVKPNATTFQTKGLQIIIHFNCCVLLFWQLPNEKVQLIPVLEPELHMILISSLQGHF